MKRIDRLRAAMAERGIAAVLVSDLYNIGWLTGFKGSFGLALVTPTRAEFITDGRYRMVAATQVRDFEVTIFQTPTTSDEALAAKITELGITSLGFESTVVTYSTYQRWITKIPAVEWVAVDDLVSRLRRVKDAEEIGNIRAACAIADAAFDHIQRMIQPGVRELDIELDLEFFIRRQDAGVAFPSIVVSGVRSASPHGSASDKPLEVGDFVTLDFGATVNGYHSDITRTVVVGESSERTREVYETVLRAQLTALDAMGPGVKGSHVDHVAREAMGDLAKYFVHGLGHTLGRAVHDGGAMNATTDVTLEVGQIWTVEPGIYIPDFGGCRIEDDVLITETGIEILTKSTKDLLVLPVA
ncbi:MAG: M24 family metallopeptidase [Fimbriimonas sp.]